MTPLTGSLLEFFLVFVRVSVCMMILPGFSAAQIAPRIRLFVALAIAISIFFFVEQRIAIDAEITDADYVLMVLNEFFIGAVLAIPIRLLFLALIFLGEVMTQFIGLNPIPGVPIGDDQTSTTLSALFNVTAVVLFFSTGLHLTFVLGLAGSFDLFEPGAVLSPGAFTEAIAENLTRFFDVVLRLGGPFVVFTVIMNLIAGLVNRLTPQIPIYFVSTPFLICGGLVMLAWIGDDMALLFIAEVNRLIAEIFTG